MSTAGLYALSDAVLRQRLLLQRRRISISPAVEYRQKRDEDHVQPAVLNFSFYPKAKGWQYVMPERGVPWPNLVPRPSPFHLSFKSASFLNRCRRRHLFGLVVPRLLQNLLVFLRRVFGKPCKNLCSSTAFPQCYSAAVVAPHFSFELRLFDLNFLLVLDLKSPHFPSFAYDLPASSLYFDQCRESSYSRELFYKNLSVCLEFAQSSSNRASLDRWCNKLQFLHFHRYIQHEFLKSPTMC